MFVEVPQKDGNLLSNRPQFRLILLNLAELLRKIAPKPQG